MNESRSTQPMVFGPIKFTQWLINNRIIDCDKCKWNTKIVNGLKWHTFVQPIRLRFPSADKTKALTIRYANGNVFACYMLYAQCAIQLLSIKSLLNR